MWMLFDQSPIRVRDRHRASAPLMSPEMSAMSAGMPATTSSASLLPMT